LPSEDVPRSRTRFPQWPLAIIGAAAIAFAIYEIQHQSHVIAQLQSSGGQSGVSKTHGAKHLHLYPVVTTTTIYPPNVPSSASWTQEVESYQNVQFGLRVPVGMNTALKSSPAASRWSWGEPRTPYAVILAVVAAKPSDANVHLGANTFGTAISRKLAVASQSLYIHWSAHEWMEVSMTVPASHIAWLRVIATSVRIS
jgi:hypothetical protein